MAQAERHAIMLFPMPFQLSGDVDGLPPSDHAMVSTG